MKTGTGRKAAFQALVAGLSLAALATTCFGLAQPPPGGGPGGPGRFGPGPGGPGMGFGRMSAATIPVAALDAELKLTDKQKSDIKQIQDDYRKEQRTLMPRFGGPGGGPPGGGPPNGGPPAEGPGGPPNGGPPPGAPPDFEQMRASMMKMRALDEKASKKIEATLTDDQKKLLPGAVKEIGALGQAGIPPDILGDLNLSTDQKSKIVAISTKSQEDLRQKMEEARQSGDFQGIREILQSSRQSTRRQIMALLTDDQKSMVNKFVKEHPMRGPGGFPGGRGGPGGPPPPEGPGGPPPPGDGPPPPPGDAGPPPIA